MKECPACRHCFPDEFNNCPSDGDELNRSISGDTLLDRRYQLDFRLGQGGMGIVFKGRHIFLKTSFAIKVILPDLVGNDPMLVTRFRQEAMVAARIRHRNIVNVTDFGVANGVMPYLVMDFVKGKSLQEVLATRGRLSPELALEIMAALCAGIGAAHREGIVHRDLKPLNIMIQDDVPLSEGIKVLDFGLAKIKSGEFLGSFVAAQTSGLMGSPFYMAPELWSDEEPDKRVDIYSLGIILFQILANDLPFKGQTIPAIMKKHLTQPPPSLAMMGLNVPPAIDRVIRHSLAKHPDERLPSVEDFMTELREAVLSAHAGFVSLPTPITDSQSVTMFLPETESGSREIDRSITSKTGGAVSGEELTWQSSLQDVSKPGGVSREDLTLPDSKDRILHEADRLLHEFEEAQRRADEARVRAEAAARRRAEEEAERRRAEEEAARKLEEEEEARRKAEEEARKHAEEIAAAKRAEEEAAARIEAEKARKVAEEEEARKRATEEAARLAREIAEAQRRADEARLLAEQEARRRTEEEAARLRAEEKARQLAAEVEEMQRRADESRQRAEEETRKRAEQEEARKLAEVEIARERAEVAARLQAEEETARKRAADEADRLAREIADAQRRADEARQRAEEETRKRSEEEEARKRAEEEARRLAIEVAEAQQRVEEVARKRAEQEERTRALEAAALEAQRLAEEAARRREAEEKSRLEAEAKRKREEEEYAAAIERNRIARLEQERKFRQTTPSASQTQPLPADLITQEEVTGVGPASNNNSLPGAGAETVLLESQPVAQPKPIRQPKSLVDMPVPDVGGGEKRKRKFMLPMIAGLGAILMVIVLGIIATLYLSKKSQVPGPGPAPTSSPEATPTPEEPLVKIDGGSFLMGRNDVSMDTTDPDDFSYEVIQYPAHPKTVKTFWMDKTEVTNEEYAKFVRETNHPPPAYWNQGAPPPANMQWPVTQVSLEDARRFAEWRSKRDKKNYQLPTEEQWEYAARNGAQDTFFPWGNHWLAGYANLDANSPKPVGSFPQGASQKGVLDLIGNVWEWTSSRATVYPGNNRLKPEQGRYVIRGGAYADHSSGPRAVSATRRWFFPPTEKDKTIGFRLVRVEP